MTVVISRWAGAGHRTTADVVATAEKARAEGFATLWLPQTLSFDAMTALAVAATAVPGIGLGTGVVPIQGRHPIPLAQQALTVADVAGPGPLHLGIGVTYAPVSEGFYGIPYADVVDLCREELDALVGLLGSDHKAAVEGRYLRRGVRSCSTSRLPGLLLAALGPKRCSSWPAPDPDGTITWMTGLRTLAGQVVPRLREAAAGAGRPHLVWWSAFPCAPPPTRRGPRPGAPADRGRRPDALLQAAAGGRGPRRRRRPGRARHRAGGHRSDRGPRRDRHDRAGAGRRCRRRRRDGGHDAT